MTLVSVHDGGLQIELSSVAKMSDIFNISTYNNSWPLGAHNGSAEEMEKRLKASIGSNTLEKATETLRGALKSTARFVLPGKGTFFYKDPIFNNHGDFLCSVRYDG